MPRPNHHFLNFMGKSETIWPREFECPANLPEELISQASVESTQKVQALFLAAFQELSAKWEASARLDALYRQVLLLSNRCDMLEHLKTISVPIETFAPEPYNLIKPFHVVVRFEQDQYIASFYDANLSDSGDTQEEAVSNLKDILLSTYDILTGMSEDELGPGPLQQRKVLEEFVRKGS